MYKILLCLLILCLTTIGVKAQTDSSIMPSSIKTLTLKQYSDYQKGPGLEQMALPATLNKYPMPDDVLHLKKELKLTDAQVKKIAAISQYLQLKKTEIGQSVLRNEKKLDELFQTKKVDEGSITFYGNRYGLYEGEYRTSVLQACYNTYNALTPQQTTQFWKLKKP
jgi:Spy/CpxP family protein refolding chaperone